MYILSWVAMVIQICFVTLAVGKFRVKWWYCQFAMSTGYEYLYFRLGWQHNKTDGIKISHIKT